MTGKYKHLLKKMGYKSDQKGIMKRYLTEHSGWEKHLSMARKFIIDALSYRLANQTVAVLGSGWLLDVPVEFLSQTFRHVIMVDVIHPPQIRHTLSRFENVKLIEQDISGYLLPVWEYVQQNKKKKYPARPDSILPGIYTPEIPADIYISLNIMNQLDILLVDYIKKHLRVDEAELIDLRQNIQQTHLNFLVQHDSILITDYEELIISKENQAKEIKPLIYCKLPSCSKNEKWRWHFDESGSYHKNSKTHFKVIALDLKTKNSDH